MAVLESIASGAWTAQAATVWDTGIAPANGDTVNVNSPHTVTFDADMSGWANGVTLTIDDGATLICSTATGDYFLMGQADITLNGILQAGTSTSVPLPSDVTFTIDFNGTAFSIQSSSTGRIYFYCQHPTNKYVRLSGAEATGQTILSVDTDVTGDSLWAANAVVTLNDLTTTDDNQETTINATAATTVTVNDALDSDNVEGAYLVLISRNIKIINTTDYAIKNLVNSWVECEVRDTDGIYFSNDCTFSYCTFSGNVYSFRSAFSCTISHCCFTNPNPQNALYSASACPIGNCLFAGCDLAVNINRRSSLNTCVFAGGTNGIYSSYGLKLQDCDFNTKTNAIYDSSNIIGGTCTFPSCTNALYNVTDSSFYNCDFSGATTEHNGYDNYYVPGFSYVTSEDHDQTANAFKSWNKGGYITSQTASPPTGYTIWYEMTSEDTTQTYHVFRQYETTVLAGTAIEVQGKIRIADGEDLTGVAPALQIIDKFNDPLIDSTCSPLDEDEIPEPNGGVENGWQDVSVIWANQGDAPRQVIVRIIVYHDGGGNDLVIDSVWSIADYQDQIQSIYDMLPVDATYLMGSDDDDAHDGQIDAIEADTNELQGDWVNGGRLDLIIDAILADTNELQTDWTNGGRLDLIIDAILVDTDEIQGKLPDEYIMGSSVTDSMDDEINAIVSELGQTNVIESTLPGGTGDGTGAGIAEGC